MTRDVHVSIRTPVKGVMYYADPEVHGRYVSIRTPVKGVIALVGEGYTRLVFQSAPP